MAEELKTKDKTNNMAYKSKNSPLNRGTAARPTHERLEAVANEANNSSPMSMRTPFKMNGHSLPGPKQSSPARFVFGTAALIAAGISAASSALSAATKAGKKKSNEKIAAGEKKRKSVEGLNVGVNRA